MTTRRALSIPIVLALTGMLLLAQFSFATAKAPKILEFDTMVGTPAAFTGATNAIRGVPGGGLPWRIASGTGELTAAGDLEVKVRGLVLDAGANAGSNPSATFRAIVSCLNANAETVNVTTAPFPATTGPASTGGGNAKIEASLTLPTPCLAPIVFVTSAGGSWFAVTGG